MVKLNQLFDMQRIIDNENLATMIDETHNRYNDNIVRLDDDEMELAVAGMGNVSDDLKRVTCSYCGEVFRIPFHSKNTCNCPKCGKNLSFS